VHGLWYGPWTLFRLERALQRQGYSTRRFKYQPTAQPLGRHAEDLHAFSRQSGSDQQHFIGHSLGGLLILRMLAENPGVAPGRVLLLGTPLGGSITARKAGRVPGSGPLLGEVREALEKGYSVLPVDRDTGMIAGSRAFGLALFTGGVGEPGDGTVGLSETEAEGLRDRIVLPVTHSGMLFSKKVIRQSVHFLDNGAFDRT